VWLKAAMDLASILLAERWLDEGSGGLNGWWWWRLKSPILRRGTEASASIIIGERKRRPSGIDSHA
jgi:hypothetical protein